MSEASPWGMTNHYTNEHLLDLLNRGGVSWIRYTVLWSIMPRTGLPNWAAIGGTIMTGVRKRGMFVYLGLDLTEPPWLYDESIIPVGQRAAAREESYTRFVTSVMDYFGGLGVRIIHVGNEPNDPAFYPFGEDAYFDRLVRTIRIIRDYDHNRGFKVAAPDLATGRQFADSFLRRCLANLRQNGVMIDVLSLHGYIPTNGSALDLMLPLSKYTPLMAGLGLSAIPIWLTETGVNMTADTANNPKDITNLCNFVRNGFHLRLPGGRADIDLKKIFWFVWSEDDHAVPGVEGKYSWLTSNLSPRPREWGAYTAAIGEARAPVVPEYDATITGPTSLSIRAGVTRTFVFRCTNTGRQAWDAGVRFENIDYDRQNPKLSSRSLVIPAPLPWPPGQARDISFRVTAPDAPGSVYRLRLQLTKAGSATHFGDQFGGRLVIKLTVPVPPFDPL